MSRKAGRGRLRIGPGLTMPLEGCTETFGMLGIRGSGKSTTARVLVEELVGNNQQCVVADPTGVWWGVKSDQAGTAEGMPFTIIGGDHADIPINADAGEQVADLVVDEHINLVLDLSGLRKAEQRRFMLAFVEQLYHRNRDAMHLVVDEADLFAPQRPIKGAERLLGAMEDLVRRGRVRGIGTTLITQRSASIHKDVLSQLSVLVAHRLIGPQDRKAIDAWTEAHGDPERRDEMMHGLAGLATGSAWFWSPAWLDVFALVKVRAPWTFDSSATPKPGARKVVPKVLSQVDVDRLRERFAEIVAESEANNPVVLRRRVADLERQLAARPAETVEVRTEIEVPVEVPVIDPAFISALGSLNAAVTAAIDDIRSQVDRAAANLEANIGALRDQATQSKPAAAPSAATSASRQASPPTRRRTPEPRPGDDDIKLKAGARRILDTLARHHPMRLSQAQVGTLAKFKTSGGTFASYKSALVTAGYVEIDADKYWTITPIGLAAAGIEPGQPMTVDEVRDQWRQALKAGARNMLDVLIDMYPAALTRVELAEHVGLAVNGGTFASYLSSLRTNGLAETTSETVRASDTLFIAP